METEMEIEMESGVEGHEFTKTIQHLRASFWQDIEAICEKYENIEDEDEGFKIEEIEKYYNSDEESEKENTQEQPGQHIHRIYIHKSAMELPHDVLIDAGLKDNNTHTQHYTILRRTKPTPSNDDDDDDDDDDELDYVCRLPTETVRVRRSRHACDKRYH